MQINGIFRDVT